MLIFCDRKNRKKAHKDINFHFNRGNNIRQMKGVVNNFFGKYCTNAKSFCTTVPRVFYFYYSICYK